MKTTHIYIIVAILIVGGVIGIKTLSNKESDTATNSVTPYDTFAQCVGDSGATFYGAYWCPHCQAQKKLFNNSKKLPYVECSTPDGKGQLPICIDKEITGYPTWVFADGSRENGELTFEKLAEKTGCEIPIPPQS